MALPRVQLIEFNDQPWVPASLRDLVIEALGRTLEWGRIVRGLVDPFQAFLARADAREVLDVGAGSGKPASILAREIARAGGTPPRFLLTDLFPRVEAWQALRDEQPGAIDFVPEPVDATAIPETLGAGRVRTIINVFHHFPPELARAILADAVRGSQGVFIAEGFERNPLQFANFAAAGLAALAVGPLLSPAQRAKKAFWTYCTPVVLATSIWDGVVSTLRVYSEDELRAMVAGSGWRWEYGTYDYPPKGRGYYFYGVPA